MRRLFGPLLYGASHALDLAATGLRQTRPRSVEDFVSAVDLFTLRVRLPVSSSETALERTETQLRKQRGAYANRLFVGSLSFNTTDAELRAAFAVVGEVVSAKVIMDRDVGRSKGFGFVEMADPFTLDDFAPLVDRELGGRRLTVNRAKLKPDRFPRRPRYGEPTGREIVRPAVEQPASEIAQSVPELSMNDGMGAMVDAVFVEIVWEDTARARQSDEALGSRR